MGSSQSTPPTLPPVETSTATADVAATTDPSSVAATSSHDGKSSIPRPKRTGIDAVNHKCRKKKAAYDTCFSDWYANKFLQQKSINQEEECGDMFQAYRQCYLKGIKREFFDKGGKQPKEGSVLAEEMDQH